MSVVAILNIVIELVTVPDVMKGQQEETERRFKAVAASLRHPVKGNPGSSGGGQRQLQRQPTGQSV